MYNSYEEYMQNVLGVNKPNTYMPNNIEANCYEPKIPNNANLQDINKLYPDIYKIVYPMVQKACSRRNLSHLTDMQINEIVDEVYNAIEPREEQAQSNVGNLRNGDVRNPRAKENRRPNNNYLLRDLIKILILREILGGNNWNSRPPMGEIGVPRPPIMRPGYMGMY